MTIHKKTFVPSQEKEIFQQMNIIKIMFFLDDDLLLQKGSQFYYAKDNNILFDKNTATNLLTGKAYNTLDFVVQFLSGEDNKTSFRLATLLLHYYHTHPVKQNNWDFAFYQKYGINPPVYETPKQDVLDTLKAQHNHSNNKYLMAHFMQLYKIDPYLLRDMIFRGFLVADSQKNACFLIYGDLENRDHVIGTYKKTTKYRDNYYSYVESENFSPFLYTFQKHEKLRAFTYCHIFSTPLEMLQYITMLKENNLKFPRGTSHLFAVFHTPDRSAVQNFIKEYCFMNLDYQGNAAGFEQVFRECMQKQHSDPLPF